MAALSSTSFAPVATYPAIAPALPASPLTRLVSPASSLPSPAVYPPNPQHHSSSAITALASPTSPHPTINYPRQVLRLAALPRQVSEIEREEAREGGYALLHDDLFKNTPDVVRAILITMIEKIINSLEPTREELGIQAHSFVGNFSLEVIAKKVDEVFEQLYSQHPKCSEPNKYQIYLPNDYCNGAGNFKQCSPELLFTLDRFQDFSCIVEGGWVAKIISKDSKAIPYMLWEAAIYNMLKDQRSFPHLINYYNVREPNKAIYDRPPTHLRSLEDAFDLQKKSTEAKIIEVVFYMDYYPANLADAIKRQDWSFAESSIEKLYKQVDLLHEAKIVHMDLKPGNIFVKGVGEAAVFKLFDFNHSAFIGTSTSIQRGTPAYLAPELWPTFSRKNGLCYPREIVADPVVDVWSIGIVLLKMQFNSLQVTPWAILLQTLIKVNQVQKTIGAVDEPANGDEPANNEMDENTARKINEVNDRVTWVQEKCNDWRIDQVDDTKYLVIDKLLSDTQLQCEEFMNYPRDVHRAIVPKLIDIQERLFIILETLKKCLEANACANYICIFNCKVSQALHPDPTKRPSAKQMYSCAK